MKIFVRHGNFFGLSAEKKRNEIKAGVWDYLRYFFCPGSAFNEPQRDSVAICKK